MSLEIKIPNVAESITEVTIAQWLKKDGEKVNRDEALVEVETDKATQELFAEESGILQILVKEGETVAVGAVIARIQSNGSASNEPVKPAAEAKAETETKAESSPTTSTEPKATGEVRTVLLTNMGAESVKEAVVGSWLKQDGDFVKQDEPICELETDKASQELPAEATGILRIVAQAGATVQVGEVLCKIEVMTGSQKTETTSQNSEVVSEKTETSADSYAKGHPSPAASKILAEKGIESKDVQGTGIDGRITKEDALKSQKSEAVSQKSETTNQKVEAATTPKPIARSRAQRRVRMTQMRKTISRRLVAVKNETAMLTTFNEVNMKPVMDMRKKYKEEFQTKHGVGLGFMSFFTKACALALEKFPEVNAMIDGTDIVYNDFVDVSVAVSAPKGLVVPVLRNVEGMSFADIEKGIIELANKAKNNTLSIEDMQGGTFTITNGGIFGSMMSTPIINAPQSAILGMHNIVERPMAVGGQVTILPMMYVALSYDHRIIDGREAVGFLVTVKKYLEEPERMLFEL
jgi:2-oxoglutarate dehydrogenase E2 component (dihydrolipoamide succinyltransferase)